MHTFFSASNMSILSPTNIKPHPFKCNEMQCKILHDSQILLYCFNLIHKAGVTHSDMLISDPYQSITYIKYCIAGYFRGGKFLRIELSQLFKGKIFTNCHRLCRVPTEKKHFEGKIFTNCHRLCRVPTEKKHFKGKIFTN